MPSQTLQLLTARETDLLELFRTCCPEHQATIEYISRALASRCTAAHNAGVVAFIRTAT